jgi:hypothetical protein
MTSNAGVSPFSSSVCREYLTRPQNVVVTFNSLKEKIDGSGVYLYGSMEDEEQAERLACSLSLIVGILVQSKELTFHSDEKTS